MTPFSREPALGGAVSAKLGEVFRATFELKPGVDVRNWRQKDVEAWDSLAQALLIAAVESEFSVEVDSADALDLTSFEAIARYLEERVG